MAVYPADAHRFAAAGFQLVDESFIDFSRENHADNLRRFRIRITQSVYEFALDPQPFKHFGNIGTAAVNEHHLDPHKLQKNQIAHDGSL